MVPLKPPLLTCETRHTVVENTDVHATGTDCVPMLVIIKLVPALCRLFRYMQLRMSAGCASARLNLNACGSMTSS